MQEWLEEYDLNTHRLLLQCANTEVSPNDLQTRLREFEQSMLKRRKEHSVPQHAVSFERAATVFLYPRAMSIFGDEPSEDQERSLGLDRAGVLLVACHTFREANEAVRWSSVRIRLISARRADRRETEQYSGT